MKTMFSNGVFGKTMGQSSPGWQNPYAYPSPYITPVQTPTTVPAVPPPPSRTSETSKPVDAATRSRIQQIIKAVNEIRNKVAAWWEAQGAENAKSMLGKRFPEYQQYLTQSMSYDELAGRLEGRLSTDGAAILDSEIASMDAYAQTTQDLYDLVFGKPGEPGVAPAPKEDLLVPGLVALGAFVTAVLL